MILFRHRAGNGVSAIDLGVSGDVFLPEETEHEPTHTQVHAPREEEPQPQRYCKTFHYNHSSISLYIYTVCSKQYRGGEGGELPTTRMNEKGPTFENVGYIKLTITEF